MQNTFQQITEIIENLNLTSGKDACLSQIEKDIVLEKLRNLYLEFSQMAVAPASDEFAQKAAAMKAEIAENERRELAEFDKKKAEETAKIQECEALLSKLENERKMLNADVQRLESERKHLEEEKIRQTAELKRLEEQSDLLKQADQKQQVAQQNFSVQQGMTEDVDLFFDMDHESYGPTAEPQPVQEQPKVAEVKPTPAQPVQPKPQPKPEPKPQPKPAPQPEPEPVSDEDDLLQFIPTSRPEPKKVEKPVQQPAQHVAAPSPNQRSLNDLFNAQKEDHSLGAQFQRAKVGDLTKAISINEKFTYIKELFNNKGEEFSAAIQKLNQCNTMEDAFNCLETLKKHYFWDSTSTAYLSLCDLLRRKFV